MGSTPIASSIKNRIRIVVFAATDVFDTIIWMIRCRKKDRTGRWLVGETRHDDDSEY